MEDDTASQFVIDEAAGKRARDLEFTIFYTQQMPRLVAFLMVQGAGRSVATDLAQDAMTEAYRQWETIDRPAAWVRTVSSRAWWRSIRRDRAETPSDDLDDRGTPPDGAAEEVESRHEFLAILRTLPGAQRTVMAWTYDGYQPTEIAALLGKDPATVRSQLRDARAALRGRYRS